MATSSFETKFVVESPEALKNLESAARHAHKYTPKHDIDKVIDEGVEKLKQSLSHSK